MVWDISGSNNIMYEERRAKKSWDTGYMLMVIESLVDNTQTAYLTLNSASVTWTTQYAIRTEDIYKLQTQLEKMHMKNLWFMLKHRAVVSFNEI